MKITNANQPTENGTLKQQSPASTFSKPAASSRFKLARAAALALLAVLLAGSAATSAFAQTTYYWDGNDNAPGFGTASGTWASPTTGTTTGGWTTDPTGATTVIGNSVTTANGDNLIFGYGTNGLAAGSITNSGTVEAGNMTFGPASGAITLKGGTIDFAATTPTITVSNILNSATINNIISTLTGTAGFTLAAGGPGTINVSGNNVITYGLQLSGTNSSFTGPVTLNAGVLYLALHYAWNNNPLILNGNAAFAVNDTLTSSSGITLNNNSVLTFGCNTKTYTFNDAVTGSGGITLGQKGQGGDHIFLNSTANTFTGPITYGGNVNNTGQAYDLYVNSLADAVAPGSGNITFGSVAASIISPETFNYTAGAIAPLTLNNRQFVLGIGATNLAINNASGQNLTINTSLFVTGTNTKSLKLGNTGAGICTFAGNLVQNGTNKLIITTTGAGTWILSGTNNYTGTTTISAGTLQLGDGTPGHDGTIANSPTLVNNGALVFNRYDNTTYGGVISGSGTVEKDGPGSLTLSGANSYSGATTVNGGELKLSTAGSATPNITVATNAAFGVFTATAGGQLVVPGYLLNNNNSIVHIDYGGSVPSTATAPLLINQFAVGTGLTLQIVGSGFLVGQSYPLISWVGSGPTDTSSFTTFVPPWRTSGTYSVSGGTLYYNVTNNSGPLTWNTSDGTWDTTSTSDWVDAYLAAATFVDGKDSVVFDDATGVTGNPTVTLNTTLSPLSVTMKSTSHDYTLSGPGGLGLSTALQLDAANTRTLTLATTNRYTGPTTVNGGTLNLSGTISNSSLTINGSGVFTEAPTGVIAGPGVTVTHSSLGNSTLTGVNTYTGVTTINSGTLQLGDGTSGHDGTIAGSLSVVNNSSLVYNRYGDTTYGGVISGGGTVTKTGPGTLALTNANTYVGLTTVSNGLLLVSTALQNGGNGNVTVQDGASFGVINLGTNYAVIGTLTLGSSGGPSTLVFTNLTNPNTQMMNVLGGGVILNGNCTIKIPDPHPAPGQYLLFYTSQAITTNSGTGFSLSLAPGVTGNLIPAFGGPPGLAVQILSPSNVLDNVYFPGFGFARYGDNTGTNFIIYVPSGTDVTALAPTYIISTAATSSPASGTALNFTTPQTYVVTAESGAKKAYKVTVIQGTFMAKGYQELILATGPVAYWPLNEPAGTTAFDIASGVNNANYDFSAFLTLGVPGIRADGNTAVLFGGGTNGTLGTTAPYSASLNPSQFTLEFWVQPNDLTVAYVVSLQDRTTGSRIGYAIQKNNFTTGWDFTFGTNSVAGSGYNTISSGTPVVAGQVYYVVASYDGTTAWLYVNGQLVNSLVTSYQPATTAQPGFTIGSRNSANPIYGTMQDVALYNRALTPAEIQTHFVNSPLFQYVQSGTNLTFTWVPTGGTLQGSTNVAGPYTNVPGATSPWTVPITGSVSNAFWRAKF